MNLGFASLGSDSSAPEALAIVDALVETSHSLVCVFAPDGRIVRFNHQCEEATGWTAADVVGRDARQTVIPNEEHEAFARFLEDVWQTRRPSPQVGQWMTRAGGRILVAWSNRPIVAADGTPVWLVTAGLRLGERERASAEVRSLHQMLEQRLVELSRLAAEQSALRRVATLVATSTTPEEIFEAVSGEMARLVGSRTSAVFRYSEDGTATVVGRYTEEGITAFALGSSVSLDVDSALARVHRTASPQRVESYTEVEGPVGDSMRRLGLRSSVAAPILVGDRPWGAVVVTTGGEKILPEGVEGRLRDFAELISLAVMSAEAREQLTESRARVVQASDDERKRLQRNLHDGAQQRLVALSLALRLARKQAEESPEQVGALLSAAADEAQSAIDELRELAQGLHPAVLTEFGLERALQGLAVRAPVPVDLQVRVASVPEHVQAAIYYVVAEALTNTAKHAEAESAAVRVVEEDGCVAAEVADDGRGGAAAGGGGLRGLRDRVEAARGTFGVESPPGSGTRIRAVFPL